MDKDLKTNQPIIRYKNGSLIETNDYYVTEFPLTIVVNKEEFATVLCSPNHLRELIIGFLASEGVIHRQKDIKEIQTDDSKGFGRVTLNIDIDHLKKQSTKRMIASCCGKSREFYFQTDMNIAKTSQAQFTVAPEKIIEMMQQLQDQSKIYQATGGLHNAAISDGADFFIHRSDIGRHNALDKLFGYCIEARIPVRDKLLLFSGRISSEILIKAAKIGVGMILSKSAPTNLAIKLAQDLNITAIGFIRDDHFNIYSHPERIQTKS
ncbi:formate dehydrogenase accessory sulfurtransferase FdhD [Staphylococcus massiliensis]|uniref:formate dehydrogenase accessory sulfurtransferase FdhD n=1 Tax=Staphylococcus massiliensis TaxID=555791 RepID=UPI001EE06BEA|nr:formate dehydrogenase accessory sulfurtransferase FdhD [Staphylococcus massiliensis]MCG3402500.1 formate dehydrogenase accessory sulfurtransferase FdhD [Staphylococcus massiliensis]